MPKRNRRYKRSRKKNFVAIPFNTAITVGAPVADAVVAVDALGNDLGEDLYLISLDAAWSIRDHTVAEGPLQVGVAHGDLSVTEIAEAINAEMTDPDDIIQKERSRRPVRKAGAFAGLSSEEVLENGAMVRTKCKFSIGDGHNLSLWVINSSGATLTTGTLINIIGTLYGRWQR